MQTDNLKNSDAFNSPATYDSKDESYFSGARRSFVDALPVNPVGNLLEIGCAAGDTGAYALVQKKCGWCCGIELCPGPAEQAQKKLNQVLLGNIEEMRLPFPNAHFDAVLISEVLEHLRDPWATLRLLRNLMKPGGVIIAGSPNVSHHSVLRMLVMGDWTYRKSGIMDGTHLRWFTPKSYRQLFTACGFDVEFVRPALPLRPLPRFLNLVLMGQAEHVFIKQIVLRAHRPIH